MCGYVLCIHFTSSTEQYKSYPQGRYHVLTHIIHWVIWVEHFHLCVIWKLSIAFGILVAIYYICLYNLWNMMIVATLATTQCVSIPREQAFTWHDVKPELKWHQISTTVYGFRVKIITNDLFLCYRRLFTVAGYSFRFRSELRLVGHRSVRENPQWQHELMSVERGWKIGKIPWLDHTLQTPFVPAEWTCQVIA